MFSFFLSHVVVIEQIFIGLKHLKKTILETFNTVNTNIFVLVFKCSFIPIIHVTLLDNNIFNVFIVQILEEVTI